MSRSRATGRQTTGEAERLLYEPADAGELYCLGKYAGADLLRYAVGGEAVTIEYSDIQGEKRHCYERAWPGVLA